MWRFDRQRMILAAAGRLLAAFLLLLPLGGASLLSSTGAFRDGEIASMRLVEEEFKRCESELSATQRSHRVVHLVADRCGATVSPWLQPAAKVEHARIDQRNGDGFVIRC